MPTPTSNFAFRVRYRLAERRCLARRPIQSFAGLAYLGGAESQIEDVAILMT